MKPTKYNTIMPRIAFENLKLIDFNKLILLIGKDLGEIYNFLAYTAYGEEVVRACGDIVEPGLLEDALLQNYAKTFNKLLKSSSEYIKNLLVSVLHKFDALNLKTMLRMEHAGMSSEDIIRHIIPLGTYDKKKCQAILSDVNSISDIVDSLRDQDFGSILREKLKTQKIVSDLSPLEAALDKEVFKGILIDIKNLGRHDKKIATNILGIEIDALNVKIILKQKALMTDYENIKDNLIPAALINEKILESAIKEPNIKSTLQSFLRFVEKKHQVYQKVFTELVEESESPISRLEFILEKASIDMSFFELKKNMKYYNIGYILAFLNMKWAEIKNLRCIINGVARNVDAEQTRELLFLPENC
ncbi:MAG: V-type ATPase subunit [Promethearchaeota archaeon]